MFLRKTISWDDVISNHVTLDSIVLCLFATFVVYVLYHYIHYHNRRVNTYQFFRELHPEYIIYNQDSCPICLSEFKAPARVDCGHAFCMCCLLRYLKGSRSWEYICALCRTRIKHFECLYKFDFDKIETAEIQNMENQLKQLINRQNSKIACIHRFIWIRSNKWKIIIITVIFTTAYLIYKEI